jgi:hypothetical protein
MVGSGRTNKLFTLCNQEPDQLKRPSGAICEKPCPDNRLGEFNGIGTLSEWIEVETTAAHRAMRREAG